MLFRMLNERRLVEDAEIVFAAVRLQVVPLAQQDRDAILDRVDVGGVLAPRARCWRPGSCCRRASAR